MAESRMLFAFVLLYALVIWMIRVFHVTSKIVSSDYLLTNTLPCFLLFSLNVLLMVELNNRNALLRTYSRTVSGSYVMLMLLTPWITSDVSMLVLQTCFIAFLLLLFSTYQDRNAVGRVYFAYLFLGLASLLWLPVLILIPFFLLFHLLYIYSLNDKSFAAAIMAVMTPYWCILPFYIFKLPHEELDDALSYLGNIVVFDFHMGRKSWITEAIQDKTMMMNMLALSVVVIMFITGVIHYIRKGFEDKIHVRMLFSFFCFTATFLIIAVAFSLFLPFTSEQHFGMTLMLLIIATSPLIAHFVTLTHTRATNILTIVLIIVSLIITLSSTIGHNI